MLETTILEYEVDCIDRKKLIKKTVLDKFHAKKPKLLDYYQAINDID